MAWALYNYMRDLTQDVWQQWTQTSDNVETGGLDDNIGAHNGGQISNTFDTWSGKMSDGGHNVVTGENTWWRNSPGPCVVQPQTDNFAFTPNSVQHMSSRGQNGLND